MSDRSAIITAVKAQVDAVANVGTTHAYQRFASNWTDFLNRFATTIASQKQTRGWIITLAAASPIVGNEGGDAAAFGKVQRTYNVQVLGFLGLKDTSNTEGVLLDLVESIMDNLDKQIDLSGTSRIERYGCGPASCAIYDIRMFGPLLCNYVEITYPVWVVRSVVYQ